MNLLEKFQQTFIVEDRYMYFVDGLYMTLLLTLGSFLLGTVVAVLFCVLRNSKNRALSRTAEVVIGFLVQLPTLVLMMVFVYIIFGSSGISIVLIVIFALTLKAAAYLSQIFYTAVNAVNEGEIEAARTLGMSKAQTFFNVVLPQAIHTAVPLYKNQFIATMQETSVVGYLAIMDLTKASNVVTARTLDAMFGLFAISAIYLLIGYAGAFLISRIDRKKHIGGDGE